MNRTIKFRGKTFHDEWVYGVPVPSADRKMWAIFDNFNDLLEPFDKVTVRPETIGQFTGFGDVNVTPIYEGDIIRITTLPAVRLSVAVNELTGSFCFCEHTITEGEIYGTTPLGEVLKCYKSKVEVIGNIHDNPELLSKTK
jgi:uncharacterized phage protein (TIGR01671 family)